MMKFRARALDVFLFSFGLFILSVPIYFMYVISISSFESNIKEVSFRIFQTDGPEVSFLSRPGMAAELDIRFASLDVMPGRVLFASDVFPISWLRLNDAHLAAEASNASASNLKVLLTIAEFREFPSSLPVLLGIQNLQSLPIGQIYYASLVAVFVVGLVLCGFATTRFLRRA
jgi:hypothetical protein